jgi:shikimate kinase
MSKAAQNESQERTGETLRARLGARSIALVGMPGSGKSSIGRRLAPRIGLPFVDADAEIEKAAGMPISEIFAKHGEPYFRDGEARVIARLLDEGPSIIATGGGALVNTGTRELIRKRAIAIWLRAEISVLMRRVRRKSDRPLLKGADPEATLQRLLNEREPIYAEADIIVMSREGPHDAVVDEILAELNKRLEARQ